MSKVLQRASLDRILKQEEFTSEQADWICKKYVKAIQEKDFVTFAGFCRFHSEDVNDWVYFSENIWKPSQILFEKERCGRDIVLKPRRIGFTTMELTRDLFYALTNPGSTTMIVAQDQKTANNTIETIRNMIDNLVELSKKFDNDFSFVPAVKNSTKTSVSFAHKATIVCEVAKASEFRANSTGRGFSINRLHATEVAFWSFPDATIKSLLTAASKAQEIVIESTANGANGWFYEKYFEAKQKKMSGYKAHFYPWFDHSDYQLPFYTQTEKLLFDAKALNPHESLLLEKYKISFEQLKWFRHKVSETNLQTVIQEYPMDEETCFQNMKGLTFLSPEMIERISRHIVEPIEKLIVPNTELPLKVWKLPEESIEYVLGSDTSYGRAQDYSTIVVCEKVTGQIAATFRSNTIDPISFSEIIFFVAEMYNGAFVTVEAQASGSSVIAELLRNGYFNLFKHDDKEYYGFNTTTTRRNEMINAFQKTVQDDEIKLVDHDLLSEARTLVFNRNEKIQHARNSHDDLIFAFMLAQYARNHIRVLVDSGYESVQRNRFGFHHTRIGKRGFGL